MLKLKIVSKMINNTYKMENIKLGSGGFSEVFLGTNILTNEKVAIKRISIVQKQNTLERIKSEIDLMKKLNHINIVTYYDVIKNSNFWYIIMEYCNAGTLENVIKFNEQMSKNKARNFNREANTFYYLNQLKDALNYIRTLGFIHRDIKPSNILLTNIKNNNEYNESNNWFNKENNYYFTEKLTVKLADFGLAKHYNENSDSLLNTICGSPLYMAPELLINRKYDSKVDLWSYGVIMYEMLYGVHPNISTSIELLKYNLKFKNINFDSNEKFTPYCFDILSRLLSKDPISRIDWYNFFNHEWFTFWRDNIDKDYESIVNNIESISINFSGNKSKNISKFITDKSNKEDDSIRDIYNETESMSPSRSSNYLRSPLGYSNLSKMKFSIYNPNLKIGTYQDYPSSYPPNRYINTLSKVNNSSNSYSNTDTNIYNSNPKNNSDNLQLFEELMDNSNDKNTNISDIYIKDIVETSENNETNIRNDTQNIHYISSYPILIKRKN